MTNPIPQANRAYALAFREGTIAAANGVLRNEALTTARLRAVREGDAFLAGYYAEKRKRRFDRDHP